MQWAVGSNRPVSAGSPARRATKAANSGGHLLAAGRPDNAMNRFFAPITRRRVTITSSPLVSSAGNNGNAKWSKQASSSPSGPRCSQSVMARCLVCLFAERAPQTLYCLLPLLLPPPLISNLLRRRFAPSGRLSCSDRPAGRKCDLVRCKLSRLKADFRLTCAPASLGR